MRTSSFFRNLRSAYEAEIDDLTSDSEGHDVLRQRLAAKRKEITFLRQMIEISPEMVAVVFHQGFRFTKRAVVERLLGLPVDGLPDWQEIAHAVALEPWAQSLAQTVLREPQGARFLTVAAGLEYLQQHARMAPAGAAHGDSDAEDDGEDAAEHDDDYNALSADDAVDPHNSRTSEESSANWQADVGFEHKE